MSVSAALVKELRERTGLGMMECKKALVESNGDIELAIENLRKSGQAKAAKKAGRVASEGAVGIKTSADGKTAVMIEVNSETDFVARDDNFKQFVDLLVNRALETKETDVAKLMALPAAEGASESLEDRRLALVQKIGENIQVRRIQLLSASGVVGTYVHGSKIGVIAALTAGDAELGRDVCMHIAAANPLVVNPSDVPAAVLEKEKEIFAAQARESGKPEEIIEKMIGGRIKKYLAEVSLVEQAFVKDPDATVGKLLKDKGASVSSFVRFEVGEGIEKEEVDFAAEVRAQANRS